MNIPNIVFILSDQHNANVVGANGDKYIRTPNIDKLAQQGVNFRKCYCASPLCVPSRTSFLTGQLPFKTNVFNNGHLLHSGQATIAHTINNAGYETVLAGRMHFTGEDQYHGFEKRLVGDLTPFYHGYDFMKETFDDLFDAFLPGTPGFKKSGAGLSSIYQFDNDVVDGTNKFLENRDDDRPLFLTIGLSAPHPPYICEKETYEYYYNILPDVETPEDFDVNAHDALKDYIKIRKLDKLEKPDIKRIRAAYYGMIEFLDGNIGRILELIDTHLGLDNTIVIYTSDHGDHMGINNMIWKGTFLDNSAKVPMLVSYPKEYLENKVVNEPCSLLDVTKTIIDMSGADDLPDMDGVSLMEYLVNSNYSMDDRPIISQIGGYPKDHVPTAMVVKGKYKLILHHGYEYPSLFNLDSDPDELRDLGNDRKYEEVIKDLSKALKDNWDGEYVNDYCNKASKHYAIINKWSHNTKFDKRENWKPVKGINYIE